MLPPASHPFEPADSNMRLEERRHQFMQNPGVTEARKRRELFGIELRTRTRSDHLCKRRLRTTQEGSGALDSNPGLSDLEERLLALKESLLKGTALNRADALSCLKDLSFADEAHDMICSLDLVPLLKGLLVSSEFEVVEDSSFVLVSLTAGSPQVNAYLASLGVVEDLLRTVSNHNLKATENALWSLCNMMVDIPETRAFLLNSNIISLLQSVLDWHSGLELLRTVSWCCNRLSIGEVSLEDGSRIANLVKRTMETEDKLVFTDSMAAISNLMTGDIDLKQQILDAQLIDWIFKGLESESNKAKLFAVRAVTAIAADSPELAQQLLVCDLFTYLKPLLMSTKAKVRQAVLACLSYFRGKQSRLTSQLMSNSIMPTAVETLQDASPQVYREAVDFFEMLTTDLRLEQRLQLICVYDIFRPLRVVLTRWRTHNFSQVSNILELLLETSTVEANVLQQFIASECLDELNKILFEGSAETDEEVLSLVGTYFTETDEDCLNLPVNEDFFFS
jgi:hypothetical protein